MRAPAIDHERSRDLIAVLADSGAAIEHRFANSIRDQSISEMLFPHIKILRSSYFATLSPCQVNPAAAKPPMSGS
jgi:hypothetical protein